MRGRLALSFHSKNIPEQSCVQAEANQTGQRRWPDDRLITAQVSIHRRHEQPQLQHHNDQHDTQDAVDHRESLFAGEASLHIVLSSKPVA